MICPDIAPPSYFILSNSVPSLLYYSHIPTAVIAILLGLFVYIKNRDFVSRALLFLSLSFSIWLFFNLIVWTNVDSRIIMFIWSFFGSLTVLIFIFAFYFFYTFIEKKDLSNKVKYFLALIFLSVFSFSPFYINNFDVTNCEAVDNIYYIYYYNFICFLILIAIPIIAFKKYRASDEKFRKQILFLFFGIELFLFLYFVTGLFAGYLDSIGVSYAFELEQYGLFGMTLFMGMLAYMIVKFKAFNIKLIGAQALVVTLFILIAAQFAFIRNSTNMVLNGITLFLVTIFGYILIRNVKREILQKEALALANAEINERKNQLQKISDHLAVANDKLKELDTAKNEFVSIVAHQLQGPPTTVKGYSMLLTDGTYGEMTPDQKDVLNKIFNANEQQIDFVRDLLNVSRLESGRINFAFETCSVLDICQEVIDNLFVKAKDKGLYLEYNKTTDDIPAVNVDKAKIREAVTNLIDNAIKYTKKGGVTVSVKVCSGTEKCLTGNHVRVTVSDTGIGVPQSEMAHLFSKFSRGKDIKRLNASGTGLGLYVVKMVVEGNHGQVWIESDGDGKGSRFIIELPVG